MASHILTLRIFRKRGNLTNNLAQTHNALLRKNSCSPHASPALNLRFSAFAHTTLRSPSPHIQTKQSCSHPTESSPPRTLITGSLGQLGISLTKVLRERYGTDNVIASDIKKPTSDLGEGPFVYADVLNYQQLESLIVDYRIDWIVHFSALLSAVGEQNPLKALAVNIGGFQNVIELAKVHKLRIFCPSTIGAFGPTTPRINTPDLTIMRPATVYGVTKVHMELLGEYYHKRFGVDFRSIRYPGIISADTEPGGGTTDYAVDIYHSALKHETFTCFLKPDAELPMMYVDDCLKATMMVLEVPNAKLKQRVYNLASISFSPEQQAANIRKHIPNFKIVYKPDFRQSIAESWPRSLDDTAARVDWGWKPDFDLDQMTQAMLAKLAPKYS